MPRPSHPDSTTGWREWVSLPGVEVPWIKAKLDTGARTSALHAFDLRETDHAGQAWVRFSVHPWQRSGQDVVAVECPVHDRRAVRSSSGHAEERIVVLMDLLLVGRTVTAEMTLSRRDEMGFRMLVGRQVLRQGFVVDSSRSYIGGQPAMRVQRRNDGL